MAESTGDFQGQHLSDVISLTLNAAASNSEFEIYSWKSFLQQAGSQHHQLQALLLTASAGTRAWTNSDQGGTYLIFPAPEMEPCESQTDRQTDGFKINYPARLPLAIITETFKIQMPPWGHWRPSVYHSMNYCYHAGTFPHFPSF